MKSALLRCLRLAWPALLLVLSACVTAAPTASTSTARDAVIETFAPPPVEGLSWEWSGGGGRQGETDVYAQDGKGNLVALMQAPAMRSYQVEGELLLPIPGASVELEAAMQEHEGKANSLGFSTMLNRDGKSIRIGRAAKPIDNAAENWLPFAAMVEPGACRIFLMGDAVANKKMPQAGGGFRLTLSRKAQVRHLKVTPLPEHLMMTRLAGFANASAGEDAALGAGGRIDPAALPVGVMTVDKIPFRFIAGAKGNAIDVASSMSGFSGTRLKYGYLNKGSLDKNGRTVFKVPGDQYSAMHLVAFASERPETVNRMTVRVGYFGGSSGILEDQVVAVPPLTGGEAPFAVSRLPVELKGGGKGYLYHLRVPMGQTANVKEFAQFDVEFTRDVNVHVPVPDPFEFGQAPAGRPSSVVVLAATMERSPIEMTYSTAEYGNIFNQPQKAEFKVALTSRAAKAVKGRAYLKCSGPGTGEEYGVAGKSWERSRKFSLAAGETLELALDAAPPARGWYACRIGVEVDGRVVQERSTSMAILAPDTRQAVTDSPFGVWCFWTAHSIKRDADHNDKLAAIIKKGGWRWTYGGSPGGRRNVDSDAWRRLRDEYKIHFTVQSPPNGYQRAPGWYDEQEFQKTVVPWLANAKVRGIDHHYKVMHESRSSSDLLRRYSELLGGTEYDMPPEEKARVDAQFEKVKQYCAAIRQADPAARIVLINDYPSVGIEYMKRGFPAELFDVFGSEGAMFMRQPERQPDWLSLLGQFHTWERAQKKYGYDKPVWTTEALYHGTAPGNLSLHNQGVISVREAMLALALGIERMAASGLVKDSSDDYHWSNWGSAGYCFRDPEMNPKPSFAMYAWLTQVLDQAKYDGKLTSPSPVLHLLRFKKRDGAPVQALWVVRGRQEVSLRLASGKPGVYDVYGNEIPAAPANGLLRLVASDSPLYILGAAVEAIVDSTPIEVPRDPGEVVIEFDAPEQFTVGTTANKVLETNWDTPRLRGSYKTDYVAEDGASCLRVELLPDKDPRKLLPRYLELALAKPIVFEGKRPWAFTMRLKGHGGWGRIMFEIIDAKGRVWTSSGNHYPGASNSSDNKGNSHISFDGWFTIDMPLPGQYPGNDQMLRWPRNFDWWPTNTPERPIRVKEYEQLVEDHAVALEEYQEKTLPAHKEKEKAYQEAKKAYPALVEQAKAEKKPKPKPPRAVGKPPKSPRRPRPTFDRGDEPVDYPIRLTKVIVSLRPHILYVDEERPLENLVLYLDKLGVVEPPPGR